jgi:hypothetical protein
MHIFFRDTPLIDSFEQSQSLFATAVKELDSVDSKGCLSAESAGEFRRAVKKLPAGIGFRIALNADEILGPFESLSLNARYAIVKAISCDDIRRMAGHNIGNWHIVLTRLLWKFRESMSGNNRNLLKKIAEILAVVVQSVPSRFLYSMHKLNHRLYGKLSARPELQSMLFFAGIEPRNLAVCYARDIPQPEAHRGFWHDPVKQVTYGVVLGLDLIPTHEGCWYIESNLNSGMSNTRSSMYDRDPYVNNMIAFATENGYRHLMIIFNKSSNMNRMMAEQFKAEAASRGVRLTIVEDAYLPKSSFRRSYFVPPVDSEKTLVVRTKCFPTSLDHLFDNKIACERALELYRKRFPSAHLLLPASGREPPPDIFDDAAPFPNLVYKMPERDAGKGVFFLKATSPDHARKILAEIVRMDRPKNFIDRLYSFVENHNGLYQQYIRSPLLSGRLYKVRSHVLITPVGIRFLSAHRVISRFKVPEDLPSGFVEDAKPYLVNLSSSSAYEVVPSDEEQLVMKASLAIAEGLSWAATYGFQTHP